MQMIPGFYFDPGRLKELSARTRDEFLNARPFPHVVIDEFVDPKTLARVVDEFPGPEDPAWEMWGPGPVKHSQDRHIEKLGLSAEDGFGPMTRHLMHVLNSRPFLEFIEDMTGASGVFPDPTFAVQSDSVSESGLERRIRRPPPVVEPRREAMREEDPAGV